MRPASRGAADEEIRDATGRSWEDWNTVLEHAPAGSRTRGELAPWLLRRHARLGAWADVLCERYWQLHELRQPRQRADGFAASVSRVVGVPIARLYRAWAEEGERRRWLGVGGYAVTKAMPRKCVRMSWNADASSVEVYFWKLGESESRVQVEHGKLVSAARVAEAEEVWEQALERLASHLVRVAKE